MKLFLGVDGGQSRTKAVIGDESGRILGSGAGGPCNHAGAAEGRARLERGVTQAVAAACEAAGLDPASAVFDAACFGMSGGPDDKRTILEGVLRARKLIVTTDAAIALSGATETGQGIIVIAGTGSIAWGRNTSGCEARAGGWGFVFGDEGSGFDMVRQALRAALRMEEGWGPRTALHGALLDAVGAASANEALHLFYSDQWPRERVAALAPILEEAALQGDGVALEILHKTAQELALLAAAVHGLLWKTGEAVQVAYIGGVFRSRLLLDRFRLLVEMTEGVHVIEPLRGPAEGALLEACRAARR